MLFPHLCFWSLHRETVHLALCLQPPTKNTLDLPARLVGGEKQGGSERAEPTPGWGCGC